MLARIINRIIDGLETRLGVPLDYLREMAVTSRAAFIKFVLFMPMGQHRGGLDSASRTVAGLTATLHQDCGTCAQIAINEALREGVPVDWLQAVLAGRPEELPPNLAEVYRFTQAVVEQRSDAQELRDRVRERVGPQGLVALAMGIAGAQVFPVVKRTMGYDVSCQLFEFNLEGSEVHAERQKYIGLK